MVVVGCNRPCRLVADRDRVQGWRRGVGGTVLDQPGEVSNMLAVGMLKQKQRWGCNSPNRDLQLGVPPEPHRHAAAVHSTEPKSLQTDRNSSSKVRIW